ncbi:hypothetical protein [Thermococcus sp. Bubb.Bath]|uniref:hypothetical protein n=1 Tax=Thermococcus sp. Bubb.Bath TaxID=1638242 RepID=UPI00143B577D|nr:hypothetical protein [Thermococcus sp. Bubb.Bath]NJF24089.1 hypothetical protein [Thermococcus sp. Bubb.Bath]
MKVDRERLFYISTFIPLLTVPWLGTTWLIFTLVGVAYKFRERAWVFYERHGGNFKAYLLVGMASAYLTEVLAIIDNLKRPPGGRALFNPNPLTDLYLAFAYYLPFVLYWGLAVRRYNYSWKEVFLIGGATGILMEQMGAVFLTFNPIVWLYVLLVYGSYKAIPVLVAERCLEGRDRKELKVWKKLVLGALIGFLAFISAGGLLWVFQRAAGL